MIISLDVGAQALSSLQEASMIDRMTIMFSGFPKTHAALGTENLPQTVRNAVLISLYIMLITKNKCMNYNPLNSATFL